MSTLSVQNAAPAEQRESFRRFVGICLAMAAIKLAIEIVGNILAQRAGGVNDHAAAAGSGGG